MLSEQREIAAYYRDPAIIERMVQYLGGRRLQEVTCVYLSRCDSYPKPPFLLKRPHELDFYLEQGMDVGRSLWDRKFLLFDLDIEYVNFSSPPEPYLQRERVFRVQEPLIRAIKRELASYRIFPLHLISGRGHHLIWQVRRDSRTFRRIVLQGYLSEGMEGKYRQVLSGQDEPLPAELGRAFSGAGLIMEFLAFRTMETASPECDVPIRITDVAPAGRGRREIVCIDLSEYGDPLHMRIIRIPFSLYRKQTDLPLDPITASQIPPVLATVPMQDSDLPKMIRTMGNLYDAAAIAEEADTSIPDRTDETESLINAYESSRLKSFHLWFYEEEHDDPRMWSETYDCAPVHLLPPCVQRVLAHPNDLLLKPAGIQFLVRVMMSLGWHPRHIAGLVRSKYERDFGWGSMWYEYDAGTRADFYVRVFSGAFVLGQDDLMDLNCVSIKEKELCCGREPCSDLNLFRKSLMNRKDHGRLGRGPFNELFL